MSPDGKSVYAVGPWFGGMVEWLRRTTDAGANHGDIANGGFYQGPSPAIQNLGSNPNDIIVTPDGKEVLISTGNNVLGWDRNTTTDPGRLTPATAADSTRCVTGSGTGNPAGTCQTREGILTMQSVAAPSNGAVYAGAQQSLSKIDRNTSTNNLTADTGGNCFGYPTSTFSGCTGMPGTSPFVWYPQHALAASPDGQNLFFGDQASPAGIFGYNRSGLNIARNPTPLGCTNTSATEGCRTFRQGNQIQQLAVSPNSRNVYAVGNNRLFTFAIDRPPVCSNVSANTANNTSVRVTFNCSDPDGDPLTFQKLTDPSKGTLAGVSGNGVSYGPQPGTSGTDSFQYRALGAGVPSDAATAFVNVSAPPPPPPPPPPGTNLTVVPSTTSINSLAFPKFTKLVNLRPRTCRPARRSSSPARPRRRSSRRRAARTRRRRFKSVRAKSKLNLRKPFKKKKLPVGTQDRRHDHRHGLPRQAHHLHDRARASCPSPRCSA